MLAPLAPAISHPDDSTGVVPEPIAHIAPDPLEDAFDPDAFAARLAAGRPGSSARCSTSR